MPESVSSEKLAYEELNEEISSLRAAVAEQARLIETLTAEIAELRRATTAYGNRLFARLQR